MAEGVTGRLQEGEGEEGRKERGITERKPRKTGECGRLAWSSSSQSPKKGYLYIIVLEPPQCQFTASWAYTLSYSATGVGRHDDSPPASSCPRCSTLWGQPADFLPMLTCNFFQWAEPGDPPGHSNVTGVGGAVCSCLPES